MQIWRHFLLLVSMSFYIAPLDSQNSSAVEVDVGIILDLETELGKMSQTCMLMALEDFYGSHNHSTRIVPHVRDSKSDIVDAASAAIDLLKNVKVQAILGPTRSTQADFVIDIGDKVKIPIVSPATSPSISPKECPYFVRTAQCSSFQAKAIAAIVQAFGWREVVFIYEDTDFGHGVIPYLTDALLEVNAQARSRTVLSLSADDDRILKHLYKLKTMQTRVFVVHMLPPLALRLFSKANEAGMMSKGYAWIITDGLTTLLDSANHTVTDSMQGVIGLKPYIPRSIELNNFTRRFRRRFQKENPDMDTNELNVLGLWAYDSVIALAMALEKVSTSLPQFKRLVTTENSTDLASIGTSEMGPKLLSSIRNIRIKGVSGDYHIVDGQLQPSPFQIVNVIDNGEKEIGFWTQKYGLSNKLKPNGRNFYAAKKDDLENIAWPGDSIIIPKGWEIPTGERKLMVGLPVKGGFPQLIKVERNPQTKEAMPTGFCVDVFKEVMDSLTYNVPCDFFPYETLDGESLGSYDELVYQIFLKKYDAVVGDITILANRSRFVDFTLPFTESGVTMIVPIKHDERKNGWIFMKPLTMDLWITTGVFFVFTGFVVWVLEHRVNNKFRGPPRKQVGMIFWFSFSTLVFAHREKVTSNLTRFVVIVWVFVVLVLTSSYTASLTSRLTVQQLQPTVTDINQLIKNGEFVGCQNGTFVFGLLKKLGFNESKLKSYNTIEEYDEALSRGSQNGGVAAIFDELPYIRLFLARYCTKYTTVGPTYKSAGFGFAFPKGSPLVPDVSRAILNLTEGETMKRISQKWLGDEADCPEQSGAVVTSDSLTLDSFWGLFLIAGISSLCALTIFLFNFFSDNRGILASDASVWQKLVAIAKIFDEVKEETFKKKSESSDHGDTSMATVQQDVDMVPDRPQSPAIIVSHHAAEGIFSPDEGLSATEPGTPIHEAIPVSHIHEI